jgi:hypothetical protein
MFIPDANIIESVLYNELGCVFEAACMVGVVPHCEASVSADDALFHHGDTLAHRNSGGGNELILRHYRSHLLP